MFGERQSPVVGRTDHGLGKERDSELHHEATADVYAGELLAH
jgi:hypothetical protein